MYRIWIEVLRIDRPKPLRGIASHRPTERMRRVHREKIYNIASVHRLCRIGRLRCQRVAYEHGEQVRQAATRIRLIESPFHRDAGERGRQPVMISWVTPAKISGPSSSGRIARSTR